MRRLLLLSALGFAGADVAESDIIESGSESAGLLQKGARSKLTKTEAASEVASQAAAAKAEAACPSFATPTNEELFDDAYATTSTTTTGGLPTENCPAPVGAFASCSVAGGVRGFHGGFREAPAGLRLVARSSDGYFESQAMFCSNGGDGRSIHGLAVRLGANVVTFTRSAHVEAQLPGERLFDFIGQNNLTAKDAMDIRVNGRLLDWDKLGDGVNGGGARPGANGGDWAAPGLGGGVLLGERLWLQQLDPVGDVMVPTCLGDARRSLAVRFALPWYHRLFEPLVGFQMAEDTLDDAGLCGGGEGLLEAWDDSLFSAPERRQLCTACGLPDGVACEPAAVELETRLRQCQARLGDSRFDAIEEACGQEAEEQQAQCILRGCGGD